jgi:DNA-binding NarL/FixJ family response regulator
VLSSFRVFVILRIPVMRYPQVLIYESDRQLAHVFRREDDARTREKRPQEWTLREPRSLNSCLRLLGQGGPSVLILKVGQDLVREFTLLERVTWLLPDTATVVVGDTDDPVMAGLAWDLGARFVLFSDAPRQQLVDIARCLLQATARSPSSATAADTLIPETLESDDEA